MKTEIFSRFKRPVIPGVSGFEKTRTQQHFADETDINKIISRAIATRDMTVFTTTQRAQFYDCSVYDDYQSALDRIADIEDDFYSLPSAVRRQFSDNVDEYVAFMADPANISKAVELGLLEGGETPKGSPSTAAPSNPAGAPPEAPATPTEPGGHSSS